ncbi:TetR/AcrR family transcriptional regulator [Patulibacter sp.]|uniref:TetR/AcrR family transcriptional regulator n=1 Tax=Patulibacter sp. TaxID=1912859 RepID=UPI002723D450|nr:TetR family transcriptional regulator [Patulibacter sp.]MDO9406948.1 TetR family transcriptional regulator [Patulibacter sp.]
MGDRTTPGRVYGGRTTEERTADRRERLLDGGLNEFASRGWDGATVAGVCERVGLSRRQFYEEHADREALFAAILERVLSDVRRVVTMAAGDTATPPEDRLRAALAAVSSYFLQDARITQVCLVESFATPRLRRLRGDALADAATLAARMMQALRATPDQPPDPALTLSAHTLTGGLAELLIAAADGRSPGTPGAVADDVADLFLAASRRATR